MLNKICISFLIGIIFETALYAAVIKEVIADPSALVPPQRNRDFVDFWESRRLSYPYVLDCKAKAHRDQFGIISITDFLPVVARSAVNISPSLSAALQRDGSRYLFICADTNDVVIVDCATGSRKTIGSAHFLKPNEFVYRPDWSHNDQYVAFTVGQTGQSTSESSDVAVLDIEKGKWRYPARSREGLYSKWAHLHQERYEPKSGPYENANSILYFMETITSIKQGSGAAPLQSFPSGTTQVRCYDFASETDEHFLTLAHTKLKGITIGSDGKIKVAVRLFSIGINEYIDILLPSDSNGALAPQSNAMPLKSDHMKCVDVFISPDGKVYLEMRDAQTTDKLVPTLYPFGMRRANVINGLTIAEEDALPADVVHAYWDPENIGQLIAYSTMSPFPQFHFMENAGNSPYGRLIKMCIAFMQEKYPNARINLFDYDKDYRKALISTYSSFLGHEIHVVNLPDVSEACEGRPDILTSLSRDSLSSIRNFYSPRISIDIPVADGRIVQAYVTLPKNIEKKGLLPTLFHEHGGPHERHEWHNEYLAQFFASRGMVVVETNQRGSTGFGKRFKDAGNGQWGRRMIWDIIDVRRALVDGTTHLGALIDPNRTAILGASYGGYASLELSTQFPGFFQACVGINGLYDLPKTVEDNRAHKPVNLVSNTIEQLGGDPHENDQVRERLEAASPLYRIRRGISGIPPVLLLHSAEDNICLPRQSHKVAQALADNGHWVRYFEFAGEGHDFDDARNVRYVAALVENFLARFLGTYADPVNLRALEGSTATLKISSSW